MTEYNDQIASAFPDAGADLVRQVPQAVLHLKSALDAVATWHQALLEAVGLWTLPQEVYQGRHY